MTSILFTNANVFDGAHFIKENCLRIENDKITEIGNDLSKGESEQVVDVDGKWLLPGLVDCHVHFREPGLVRKEGYEFGSRGALHGGVTTICEIQNNPPLMSNPQLLQEKFDSLRNRSFVDYVPYGSLVEESLEHLPTLSKMCPAVKCFLGCSTGAGGVADTATLRRWFAAAAAANLKVVAHCEDNDIMDAATKELAGDPELYKRHDLRRSVSAEVESIREAIAVAIEVGCELHVFHISTAEGAQLVVAAAEAGHPITGTTAPHYLLATAEQAHAISQNRFKVNPAIKYKADGEGIASLIATRKLAGIGTDHAPHPLDEKDREYTKAPSGFPSIDLLLPLIVAAADMHKVDVEHMLHAVTLAPAQEFGLNSKGRLSVGADADLVIADPQQYKTVNASELPSRSRWSPYDNQSLRAFPQQVYLRGELMFANGKVVGVAKGQPLFDDKRVVSR
ncbi:MAG: dihydroorotase [Myxococcota bacterium]|jgi:dihydroorotase